VHVGETFNRFAVLGLSVTQKNSIGDSLGELAFPDSHSHYKGNGRERRRRKRLGIESGRKGGEAKNGEEGVEGEREEGGLDLDICPGAPEFLVTPLSHAYSGI